MRTDLPRMRGDEPYNMYMSLISGLTCPAHAGMNRVQRWEHDRMLPPSLAKDLHALEFLRDRQVEAIVREHDDGPNLVPRIDQTDDEWPAAQWRRMVALRAHERTGRRIEWIDRRNKG
ncbi:hypothetical protein [Bifidobacterium sp. SO1]|uniref:hypothetical protein n=1 Tax=Bifidobacterium sp. SO1 TaxID=2809029 RepID=UPI001BDCBFAA|nr:hypothetical protein [Bifidobacterium sp. SO1]MBT1161716.1 hypothetical protein [Bifidobacterium sp. SO1]